MRTEQLICDEDWKRYASILSIKLNSGFIIEEKNDKLPFAVLSKEKKKVNRNFNIIMCCVTFGLWSIVWGYLYLVSKNKKKILVAIDEDGNTFVEDCF